MLGALFYPKGTEDKPIPFDSLYIPYIYKEIYFDGVYIDILNGKNDMTILDVGANIGVVTQHLQPHAKKLYAIEPSPEHFEALKKNKEFNNWDNVEVFNIALADKDGEMEFSMNDGNRTMNTLIVNPNNKSADGNYILNTGIKGMGGEMHTSGYNTTVSVKTFAIDTFFEENKIDEVDFMKFDVEGSEDMILRSEGFKKVADRIKAIEIEFHFPSWPDLAQYLLDMGYKARRYNCSAIVILFSR